MATHIVQTRQRKAAEATAGRGPDPYALAAEAAGQIRAQSGIESAEMVLVLGSGWAHGADRLGELRARLPIGSLTGFSPPVVAGHGGEALVTELASGKTALVLTGRTHLYEGKGVFAVVHGVRVAAALGATTLVVTNGCGGLEWGPGTVVLIKDHINLTGDTPLTGPRFIDMTSAYTPRLREIAHLVDPDLPEGVYAQFRGPSYETPAEVRMAGLMGASLVGMSTAIETIAAVEAGLEVLGLSLVTNYAAGISPAPGESGTALDHAEVLAAGQAAGPRLARLLELITAKI